MIFNPLIPELSVSDLTRSLAFYVDTLKFRVVYERPAQKFCFLSLDSAQIMLEQVNPHWETAPLTAPYGRGVNFQFTVADLDALLRNLEQKNHVLFREPRTESYEVGPRTIRQREFLVMDPDGYLLRFCQRVE